MKRTLFITYLALLPLFVFGQQKTNFIPPMDIPLILSGNFGELRTGHFHSGIDIKTKGVSGQKVFAIEDGYVSRIKVEPGGYGKALYIAHPSGHTSVYGHLSTFNSAISSYTLDQQYKRKSHKVDLYLKPGVLPVSKGEIVALSGNTGSSSGPHLHFEIRSTSNQYPQNVLQYKFPIEDNIAPVFKKLVLYPLGPDSQIQNSIEPILLNPKEENGSYFLQRKEALKAYGEIGIGIEVYDYLNGARNRCGIYSIELIVDGKIHFYSEMDEFSFGESRFINAHIDYALKQEKKFTVQQLFMKPYNELSIYKIIESGGLIELRDTLRHEILVRVKDTYGNSSELLFSIKGSNAPQQMIMQNNFSGPTLPYNSPSTVKDLNIELSFPAYCFYDDVEFTFVRTNGREDILSDVFHIHNESTAVHKNFQIALTPTRFMNDSMDKLCIVKIEKNNELSYAGGSYKGGQIVTETRTFGNYAISIDTIAPSINALNIHKGKNLSQEEGIRFKIKDDLSGIKIYKGLIDKEWVLFQYDPKNDLLFYEFDDRISNSEKNHELEIYLEDDKGNRTSYTTQFYR